MSTQPEFLIGSPGTNGPLFTIIGTDGVSSASLVIDTNNVVSFTGSFPISMSYAINAITASTSNSASYVTFSNIANTPTLVSSSAQISYTSITNIPAGIVSSSAQTTAFLSGSSVISSSTQITVNLPSGVVSSSAQVIVDLQGSNVFSSSAQLPANIVSSSAQILVDLQSSNIVSGSAQTLVNLQGSSVVSGSAQTLVNLQGSNVVSGSAQTIVNLQASGVISSSLQFTNTSVFNVGTITASSMQVATLVVTTISSSVDYSSGSNIFGNSLTTTQQFTGSVSITGSLTVNGPINTGNYVIQGTSSYSTNAQTASYVLNAVSASYATTASFAQNFNPLATASYAITAATASYVVTALTASYVVTANTASYVTWTNVASKPAGIVSSSAQVIVDLQTSGIISSSAQFTTSDVFNVGQVSASFYGTASWAQNARTASYVLNAVSASYSVNADTASYVSTSTTSSYVTWTNVANKPAGIVSSSAQVLVDLQGSSIVSSSAQTIVNLQTSGIISASTQFNGTSFFNVGQVTASFTGSLTGVLIGTASWATNAVTASYVNTRVTNQVGTAEVFKTTSQNITVANTFQFLSFDTAGTVNATDWTFGNGALTASTAATYSVDATVYLQKTAGTSQTGAVRLLKNGVEISGSYSSFIFASNNVPQPLIVQVAESFGVNDILTAQIAGGSTNVQAVQAPTVGSPVTRPVATIRAVRS